MGSRRPRKDAKRRATKPVFTIYTEGTTEKEYFLLLARELRPCPVTFDIKVIGGDPSKVFSDLENELIQRLKQSKREGATANQNDRAFIVVDVDEHHKLTETLRKCESSTIIDAVVSNPCFELWLLWHKTNITRFMTTSDCVRNADSNRITTKKHLSRNFPISSYQDAIDRALSCHHSPSYNHKGSNPSSSMPLLINQILQLKDATQPSTATPS
jgi:hypothetical protein